MTEYIDDTVEKGVNECLELLSKSGDDHFIWDVPIQQHKESIGAGQLQLDVNILAFAFSDFRQKSEDDAG